MAWPSNPEMPGQPSIPKIYRGTYRHGIDPKKRITIPSVWCPEDEEVSDFCIRIDSTESYIMALLPERFASILESIESDPTLSEIDRRDYARYYNSTTLQCGVDKQRRMVLPADFCQAIHLEGEAVLVGNTGQIEIWNPARWEAYRQASEARNKAFFKSRGL